MHHVAGALCHGGQVVSGAGTEQASGARGAGALVPLPRAPLLAIVGVRTGPDWRLRSEGCDGCDCLRRSGVGSTCPARGALSALPTAGSNRGGVAGQRGDESRLAVRLVRGVLETASEVPDGRKRARRRIL